jgi:hypothetical protein
VSSPSAESILADAIPGHEVRSGRRYNRLTADLPQAWKFWRGKGSYWAAFVIVGEHISEADKTGIARARELGTNPVLVLSDYAAMRATSPHYRNLRPFLAFQIAGAGSLIPPLNVPARSATPPAHPPTRIPQDVLERLLAEAHLPAPLLQALSATAKRYRPLWKKKGNDDKEEAILLQYAHQLLQGMGLRSQQVQAAKMIRTLERAGLGATRDHFFHSFQNYFLGLTAVARLRENFAAYKHLVRLDWAVDPFHVWFFTALWHDVGYALQKFDKIYDASLGHDDTDHTPEQLKQVFLNRPTTQEALRVLSSLIARFLEPDHAHTQWFPPGPRAVLGDTATQVHSALCANVNKSHGAIGALRLYCDYSDDLDRLEPSSRDVLKQTMLLACCSIPFHDWWFRHHVRSSCGHCRFSTRSLPFASLLAFVDSIQDDRRGLAGIEDAVVVLQELLVQQPATVSARINPDALTDENLLEKIVEGRDVLASLDQSRVDLFFEYPEWVASQL